MHNAGIFNCCAILKNKVCNFNAQIPIVCIQIIYYATRTAPLRFSERRLTSDLGCAEVGAEPVRSPTPTQALESPVPALRLLFTPSHPFPKNFSQFYFLLFFLHTVCIRCVRD